MKNALINVINNLNTISKKNKNNKLRYFYNNNLYKNSFLFMNNAVHDNTLQKSPYKDIILNYMMKSEKILPGGSELFVNLCHELLFRSHIEKSNKQKCNLSAIEKMANDFVFEDKIKKTILNTIKFAGPEGSINCFPTKNNKITITKNNNPKIDGINIVEDFSKVYFSKAKEITNEFLVLCLDAFLERESEIMSAIDFAFENKKPLIVFARGYSLNFVNNIKSIILKNKLKVFLYEVKFDNEDPFLLEDISNLSKSNIISAEKGHSLYKDLVKNISNVKLKISAKKIEFINCYTKKIVENINKSLSNIDYTNNDLRKYLSKRKKRLTPNTVNVEIPSTEIRFIQDFKSLIYMYNNAAISGTIDYQFKKYPARCFEYIEKLSFDAIKTFNNIGYVIKENKKND